MAEQLGFEQMLGDRRAVDGDEWPVGPLGAGVEIFGHDLLAGAALAGDENRGVRACDLVGELDDLGHGGVAIEKVRAFPRDGSDDRGDQFGVRGQGNVFLCPGADGVDGGGGVGFGAAGDNRYGDALGVESSDQRWDIDHDVDQQQIRTLA